MNLKYIYKKPDVNKENYQLFAEDKDSEFRKKYFFLDHKDLYKLIIERRENKKRRNYYEDYTHNKLIRLHFDIDYKEEYEHEVYKIKKVNKILSEVIPQIESKINIPNVKSIVWMSNGLKKLSLHIIFPEIYFRSIKEMGYFVSDIKYLDMKIYRTGCFRLPLCCKFGINNRLEYYLSYNYDVISDQQLFLDSCITNETSEVKHILSCGVPKDLMGQYIKQTSGSQCDYYYPNKDINIYLINLEESLNKIDLSGYDVWLNVTASIKDLYINLKGTDEEKEQIYDLYDNICSKQEGYNKIKNRKTFDKLDSFIDINYIFYLSDIDVYFEKVYKIKEIMFNANKYKGNIIKSYSTYINLDLEKIKNCKTHFWKSPPGTGKTFLMKKFIKKLKSQTILSITSRVNLAGEHMVDLELNFYKKTDIKKSKKLAIQLESLYKCKLSNFKDGILILDEINSLLTHLRSPTVTNRRALNFTCLIELIKTAKYVICLDADMCDWNIEFIKKIRCNKIINNDFLVYYNVFPNKLYIPATLYDCEYTMINKMVELANRSEVFVACFDSIGYMECIIKYLSDYISDDNILVYSSKVDYGTINTDDWVGKYVFYTPSIIYGVSYDKVPTEVFCFIKKTHLNCLQIYQMSNRVRKIKRLNMYCTTKCEYNKYKSLEHVKAEYELFSNKLMENTGLNIEVTNEETELYQMMYFNHIYLDSVLKTNTYYYLFNMLYDNGFTISKNTMISPKLYLKKEQINSEKIHDDILEIFNVKNIELSEFEHSVLQNSSLLEKHFNLRAYIKSTIDKKLEDHIMKAMFTESLKNRYVKLNLFSQLLKELGFESLSMLKYEEKSDILCEECIKSIKSVQDGNNICKSKIKWCNELIKTADDKNKQIYLNIMNGNVKICKNCKYLINKNKIITNMLEDKNEDHILNKFDQKINSEWINNNLDYILKIFDIRSEKSVKYYDLYLLMITMFKHLFDKCLLNKNRVMYKNKQYYIYSLNNEMFDNHKNLMDILDKNNFQKNYRESFAKYVFDDEEY